MKPIPYARQDINDADIAAVIDVLKGDWLTQGPVIEKFERAVADYCGARYAVAVSNGTAALHLACMAAGLGPDGLLWTSPNTFVASANCGRYCGADVDFVDIDDRSYNISIAALHEKLESAARQGKLPSVLVPVHFSGQPCEMAEIGNLARYYGFRVIEDASHAIGASYQGRKIGACTHSDLVVLSFHPVKIITSGEGGMILTNREDLYQKLLLLRSHGITRDPAQMESPSEGPWYYQQIDLGYNYRITDIQAALGLNQLGRIDEFIERRRAIAARYDSLLSGLPLTVPWQLPDGQSSFHLYVIRLLTPDVKRSHREVFERLRESGVMVNLHYIPVHLQPYYRKLGFAAGDFPEAERYYGQAISLPMFYGLTDAAQDRVVAAVREALE